MSDSDPIVVNIDHRDETGYALARAEQLALAYGAPLVLTSVVYDPYIAGDRFTDSDALQGLRNTVLERELEGLEALASGCRERGVTARAAAVWHKRTSDALSLQVMELNARMLVVPAHKAGFLQRMLFSNMDWEILSRVPCPILRVTKDSLAASPVIAAAVDPLHENDKPAELDTSLVEQARSLTGALGGDIHLLHAVEEVIASGVFVAPGTVAFPAYDESVQQRHEETHRTELEKFATRSGIAHDHAHLVVGPAATVLVDEAHRLETDILIMGVMSRSRLQELVIGNTAERILQRVDCDLMIVKPVWFEADVDPGEVLETLTIQSG